MEKQLRQLAIHLRDHGHGAAAHRLLDKLAVWDEINSFTRDHGALIPNGTAEANLDLAVRLALGL